MNLLFLIIYNFFTKLISRIQRCRKILSAKYYRDNKERLVKKVCERYQSF